MLEKADQAAVAIQLDGLGVCYRRYRRRLMTLKEAAVNLFRGSGHEDFWALKNVDLTIRRGESVGIIGPNGAGKSTLLKAVAGVMPPSEGSVRVNGRIAPLINLGAGFNNELTGRENILLNGAIMGLSRAEMNRRMDRIVEFAGVGEFIDVPLNAYSSGMKARLGFAVVSDVDADVVLLDEIFSVGDEEFKAKASARTEEFFQSRNMSVILVSHSLELVEDICDRVIHIDQGSIVDDGPPHAVIASYRESVLGSPLKQQQGTS